MLNAGRLAETLSERFGVTISGKAADGDDGKKAEFRASDLSLPQGFSVKILIGWRTVEAQFLSDTYAAELLDTMGRANADQRIAFGVFIQSATNDGASVSFRINNQDADPLQPARWPSDWKSLSLSVTTGPIFIDGSNPTALDALALTWSGRLLGSVIALLPLESVQAENQGEAEGGAQQILINRYERSRINRAACIEIHGMLCKVCKFDFGVVYGEIGRGFIEVHHIEPVAGIPPDTIVNPAMDLAPVCPNCHAMLHRRKPPYGIDELRAMLQPALGRPAL